MNHLSKFVKELSDDPLMWLVYAFLLGALAMLGSYAIAKSSKVFQSFLGFNNE